MEEDGGLLDAVLVALRNYQWRTRQPIWFPLSQSEYEGILSYLYREDLEMKYERALEDREANDSIRDRLRLNDVAALRRQSTTQTESKPKFRKQLEDILEKLTQNSATPSIMASIPSELINVLESLCKFSFTAFSMVIGRV